jgi:hypothetical protein
MEGGPAAARRFAKWVKGVLNAVGRRHYRMVVPELARETFGEVFNACGWYRKRRGRSFVAAGG